MIIQSFAFDEDTLPLMPNVQVDELVEMVAESTEPDVELFWVGEQIRASKSRDSPIRTQIYEATSRSHSS